MYSNSNTCAIRNPAYSTDVVFLVEFNISSGHTDLYKCKNE